MVTEGDPTQATTAAAVLLNPAKASPVPGWSVPFPLSVRIAVRDKDPVMVEKQVIVQNQLGIHARPATLLVQMAAKFEAEIYLSKGEVRRINGKSIMGVMMLAAEHGAEVLVEADGEDEAEAVQSVTQLLASKFEDLT